MAAMTDSEILEKVKKLLMITGTFHDDALTLYIEEVTDFMRKAGVSAEILSDSASVGCIMRGVSDLWTNEGNAKLSEYFKQRVTQLSLQHPPDPNTEGGENS